MKQFVLFCVLLAVISPEPSGHASFNNYLSINNQFQTGSGFAFLYLFESTEAPRPFEPLVPISTGKNETLNLHFGTVYYTLATLHYEAEQVIRITNKGPARILDVELISVQKPLLSLATIKTFISLPSSISLPANGVYSMDVTINIARLLSLLGGSYEGKIIFTDRATGQTLEVPLFMQIAVI